VADLCGFDKAWIGKCRNRRPCAEHAEAKCESCGSLATRSCDETGQFACGAPLCGDCDHRTFSDGTNGGVGFNAAPCTPGTKRHVRKSEQTEKPWYERKEPSDAR